MMQLDVASNKPLEVGIARWLSGTVFKFPAKSMCGLKGAQA
jgi:hypothetical protein